MTGRGAIQPGMCCFHSQAPDGVGVHVGARDWPTVSMGRHHEATSIPQSAQK